MFLLWSAFLLLTGAIVYLSLQDGITAKEQMYKIVEYLQKYTEIDLKDILEIQMETREPELRSEE